MDHHALFLGFDGLEFMRRHFFTRTPINDHWLVDTQPLGSARHVHGRVTPAVNYDPSTQLRRFGASLHAPQHRNCIKYPASGVRWNIYALG